MCAGAMLVAWNYLRVRGEYRAVGLVTLPIMELPPRTRRIQARKTSCPISAGTTSAYAENTR